MVKFLFISVSQVKFQHNIIEGTNNIKGICQFINNLLNSKS